MIKKFDEFEKIEEGIVDNFKKFFSKEKEEPVRTSTGPTPTPSNDPSFNEDNPDFEKKIRRKVMSGEW